VVRAAVAETNGKIPVIAGCGYGTAIATDLAQSAEKEGADGILLLPPYLMNSTQDGLAAHVEAVCKSTSLGVIVYNRDNAVLQPETLARLCDRNPNLVGFKDGVGDIEKFVAVRQTLGERFAYLGGLPTAEVFAAAYKAMGCPVYSSAVFNFAPRSAMAFYEAHAAGDNATCDALIHDFFLPYIALRNRGEGYAVSIVKAGATIVGHSAGPVRPPLSDLQADEFEQLRALIATLGPQ
jgi:5-dehydro-4-deoxyglucarate dehydratase